MSDSDRERQLREAYNRQDPKRQLLERAVEFDQNVKHYMDKRTRERDGVRQMHDTAKRTMDETAKRLGL